MKVIKGSRRGLTFSFVSENGTFEPGTHYRYIVDKDNSEITILPSNDGGNTVSKKRSGLHIKSLIDLRSKEVTEIVSKAKHMEIEFTDSYILVSIHEETAAGQIASIHYLDIKNELLMAAGGENETYTAFLSKMPNKVPWTDEYLKSELPNALRVISLFSGAGMMDYAFAKDPRFKIVYAAEYMHDAVRTYEENIGMHIEERDIRTLKGTDMPEADIMIGGPPCQPFSNANRHDNARGELHKEGDMFAHYVRLIRECGVKAFLIENVPALLTAKMGYYVDLLRDKLPDYHMAMKVVTDSDLGGYTKRKRAIIIGCKTDTPVIPDLKIKPARAAGTALLRVTQDWPNFSDVTVSSKLVRKKISLIPEGGNWQDLPAKYWTKSVHSNMYRRIDRNKPAISIANWRKFLLSPPKWTDSDEWDRILTVSEAAALQGFDKHFRFLGSVRTMQQQVANGVTAAIASFCKNILGAMHY